MKYYKPNDAIGAEYVVPFRMYSRPNGRQSEILIPVQNKEIKELAEAVIANGGRFECETLNTGVASFTCHYNDEDIAIELVFKKADADDRVATMIRAAFDQIG